MIRNHKVLPGNRPFSRLQNPIYRRQKKAKINGSTNKTRSPSKGRVVKRKNSKNSPTKENAGPRVNLHLPSIYQFKKANQQKQNNLKQVTDFETYCAEGHPVFVDERDAGVKLGHLNKSPEDSQKKNLEKHIGETAYIPYNLDILKKKVGEKVNTSISNSFDESKTH